MYGLINWILSYNDTSCTSRPRTGKTIPSLPFLYMVACMCACMCAYVRVWLHYVACACMAEYMCALSSLFS